MTGRFQFSICSLFVAISAVAAIMAAVRAKPSWQSFLALEFLNMLLSTGAIVAMRHSHGELQTFWTGLTVGSIVAMYTAGATLMDYVPDRGVLDSDDLVMYATEAARTQRLVLPVVWCGSALAGTAAMAIHRLLACRR
ncbi:MAG: hypothetical protein ACREHD_29100 [Pirellulales bacterium]